MHCSQCGADNRETAKFCDSCGSSLRADALAVGVEGARSASVSGERRHVTVLFCDLANSTNIAAQLDPEEWREIVAAYHRAAAQAIERFGGHVAQYLGDGVMAYFGWPEAHDNAAESAAYAGLAIVEQIAKLRRQPAHGELSARVGIDSGAVVIGAGAGKAADVFGDVPNIAARTQAVAEPDTVVVTGATQRLIAGLFVVEDRGARSIKGIERPIQLYRLVRPRGAQGRLEALAAARGLTQFVGRQEELRLLINCWEGALAGGGRAVSIIGEPGIGKSRLLQRFHEQIAGTPHAWTEATASPFFRNTPFYPVADMVRGLQASLSDKLGRVGEVVAAQRRQRRASLISTGGSNGQPPHGALSKKDEQIARFESPLELKLDPPIAQLLVASPAGEPASLLASEQQRRRLLATLVEWVLGSAQVMPVVIAIENLHWADPSTLELIERLVEQCAGAPLLLLFTARPEFRAHWQAGAHLMQITLNPLNTSSARTIVEKIAAETLLPEDTIATVVERSGGVPLFVEELTRAVIESGGLGHGKGKIPATLHDSLMARLDRLGAARETLQLGAVLGIEFGYDLLRAITPLNEDELQRHLLLLTDAGLLYGRGVPPTFSYQFKHALIRDAAYETLLKSRRRQLHAHIAQTIEERFPGWPASHSEILAYHYTEAGLITQAVRYWRKAGRSASGRSAYAEAISHLNNGLELVRKLPETADRAAEELRFQIALTEPLTATKGYTAVEVEKACSRAWELCQQIGKGPQLFAVLARLYSIFFSRGELQKSFELAREMLSLAERQQERFLLLWAHYCLGQNLSLRGQLVTGRAHTEQSLALYDFEQPREYGYVLDPGATALARLAHILHLLGYPDRALETSRKALAHARKLSQPFTLGSVLDFVAYTHAQRGDFEEAEALWTEQVGLCTQQNFPSLLSAGVVGLAMAMAEQGRAREAISCIREGREAFPAANAKWEQIDYLIRLACVYRKLRWPKEGLAVVIQAVKLAEEMSIPEPADLYYLKGEMLLMEDPTDVSLARQCFWAAIEIARSQRAKIKELQAASSLARLLAREGRRGEGRTTLAEVYEWFTEGFDIADLKQAKALLEELGR
jgi:class 3 adenylate cyclase/tetratricopeptide (TPR) repeat protein